MALVLVDSAAHPHAAGWYGLRRPEPIGRATLITPETVVPIANLTFEQVLENIVRNGRAGGNVVIVSHAREGGIALPIVSGAETRARGLVVGVLGADRETTAGGITVPAMDAGEAALNIQSTSAVVLRLRGLMNQIRAMHLNHIALRGCNVGAWENQLAAYKTFFGATTISGPRLRDSYGHPTTGRSVPNITAWATAHQRWHTFIEGAAGDQIGIATQGGQDERHSYHFAFAYQTATGQQTWANAHVGGPPVGNAFHYHAMFITTAAPGSPQLYFTGMAEYAANLAVA